MKPKKTYKDKKYTFVRFGKINIFKQKGFKQIPEWVHNPPSTKGFYAFPYMSQEHFLLGSIQSFQPQHYGKKEAKFFEEYVNIEKEYEKYENDYNFIWSKENVEKSPFLSDLLKDVDITKIPNTEYHIKNAINTQIRKICNECGDKFSKYKKNQLRRIRREFYKDKGYVWHHLDIWTKQHLIVDKHGFWVKTDMKTWQEAYQKAVSQNFSRDYLEVFFDEKV